MSRSCNPQDWGALNSASKRVAAASNHVWRAMMRLMYLPVRVGGLPPDLQTAWNLLSVPTPSMSVPSASPQSPSRTSFQNVSTDFYTIHVRALRQAGCECLLDSEALKFKGARLKRAILQQSNAELATIQAKAADRTRRNQNAPETPANTDHDASPLATVSTSSASPVKIETPVLLQDVKKSSGKKNAKGGKSKKKAADEDAAPVLRPEAQILAALGENRSAGPDTLLAAGTPLDHPLLGVKVQGSASPKINFIINEVSN